MCVKKEMAKFVLIFCQSQSWQDLGQVSNFGCLAHARESRLKDPGNFFLESRIREIFACGIKECGSTNNWNRETKNLESRVWSPESKTVLDSLIWARWFANLSSSGGEWLTRQR